MQRAATSFQSPACPLSYLVSSIFDLFSLLLYNRLKNDAFLLPFFLVGGTAFFSLNPGFLLFLLANRGFLIYFHVSNQRVLTNVIFDSVSVMFGDLKL